MPNGHRRRLASYRVHPSFESMRGLLDTLTAIAGAPARLDPDKGFGGYYYWFLDRMTASKPELVPDVVRGGILPHEFGHKLESTRPDISKEFFNTLLGRRPISSEYAAENPREHFAEAFLGAFTALTQPEATVEAFKGERGNRNLLGLMSEREKEVPGTLYMTAQLISSGPLSRTPMAKRFKESEQIRRLLGHFRAAGRRRRLTR